MQEVRAKECAVEETRRAREEAKRAQEEAEQLVEQRRIDNTRAEIERAFTERRIHVDLRLYAYRGRDRALIVGSEHHVHAAIKHLKARRPSIEVIYSC